MKHRRFLLLTAFLFILAGVIYAQGRTPSLPGVDPQMSWSELASLLAVLAGISSIFQWIITRAIIQPQIRTSVELATKEIMSKCLDQFTSKYAFVVHESDEKVRHQNINESLQALVEHVDAHNERLTDVRERVRVLEAYRARS